MPSNEFYGSAGSQNIVKTKLVSKYFSAWCSVILPRIDSKGGKIAYVDLCSGPGRFTDGIESTPLWVLRTAIKRPDISQRLVTIFNDVEASYTEQLRQEVQLLPNAENLAFAPRLSSVLMGPELIASLGDLSDTPTLFFIDPWGYKGLTLDLIGRAIRGWGSECIFFFNYNRVNLGISNPKVAQHMSDLFGNERFAQLRARVEGKESSTRQSIIMDTLTTSLEEVGGQYILPFEFMDDGRGRTSHYVIFVTKRFRGYDIMKENMISLSSDTGDVRRLRFAQQGELFTEEFGAYSINDLKERADDPATGHLFESSKGHAVTPSRFTTSGSVAITRSSSAL